MALVVFLRGLNVGGHRRFRSTMLAEQLRHLDAVSIGAAGTRVIRKRVSRAQVRTEVARRLPFEARIMICEGREIASLLSQDFFAEYPVRRDMVRFVSVLSRPPSQVPPLPISIPSEGKWLLRVLARDSRFIIGVYRREMKVISCLGMLDRICGEPVTTRNWNTIRSFSHDETAHVHGSPVSDTSPGVASDLAAVRAATAKYHDVEAALADGYQLGYHGLVTGCISNPTLGAMGYHYFNWAKMDDPNIVAGDPEVLVYHKDDDGTLVLGAVEWVVPKLLWESVDGRPASSVTVDLGGTKREREHCQYDASGRKTKVVFLPVPESNGANCSIGSCGVSYGVEGTDVAYAAPGATTSITIYDEHEPPTEVMFRDANDVVVTRVVFARDHDGRLLSERMEFAAVRGFLGPQIKATMPADEQASLMELFEAVFRDHTFSVATYAYDESGRRVESVRRMGALPEERVSVRYDEFDNPVDEVRSEMSRDMRMDDGEVKSEAKPPHVIMSDSSIGTTRM